MRGAIDRLAAGAQRLAVEVEDENPRTSERKESRSFPWGLSGDEKGRDANCSAGN